MMKFLVLAGLLLGILCALDVQAAGPLLGALFVVTPIVLLALASRAAARFLFGFHRKMRQDGLW